MPDFISEQEISCPVAIDTIGETVKAFHVDSYPDYYIIDRSGDLRVADLANSELERVIMILLDEKAPD